MLGVKKPKILIRKLYVLIELFITAQRCRQTAGHSGPISKLSQR
jgi:hypothetical protein